jgi:hypothetical protein
VSEVSVTDFSLEVKEDPAHYVTFDVSATTKLLLGFSVVVFGWALKNPSGSVAAAIDVYDTPDGTGVPVFPVTLASSESVGDWFGPNGVWMKNAVFVNVTAGEVKGAIFYRHVRS